MSSAAEHDLLYGVTALELRFVTQEQLVRATAAGGDGAGSSLGERLVAQHALTAAEAAAVAAVVRERLARFGNDARVALESVGAASGTADGAAAGTVDDRYVTAAPRAWSHSAPHQRFTVLRLHQQGGLGRLMIAQDEELNREIALKEILPAYADSDDNRRRFIREAEITGALEHPGIVPVYSLGEFPDGRPYYAMRLIRGVDLRAAIEDFHSCRGGRAERQLAFRQLLARFVTVCHAVDYAHHRGVLHRDLKPSNIMLGDYGETLVVDWGLAKTLDGPPSSDDYEAPAVTPSNRAQSDATQAGRIVGTMPYASPEQAEGRVDRLTPASDIYGLGATLYHLLAGRPPFDGNEEDLVLRVQRGRFAPPRQHCREAPKALSAACLKAMARKPEDRYRTARDLALDVERYLADERVLAYAEPLAGRAWRWIRRHRAPVLSGMAAAAVLVAALSVGVGLLKVQRDRAERNFQLAQQAVRDYFVSVSEETLLNQPGMQPLRDSLLKQALAYYDRFLAERGDDPQLRREVAQANFFVGRITETVDSPAEALPHFERAAEAQHRLVAGGKNSAVLAEYAQTLNALGRVSQQLERFDAARTYYGQASELREKLATAAPEDVEAARALASSVMNLGVIDLATGRAAAALPQLERAQSLRLAAARADDEPGPKLRRDIGMGYFNLAQAQLATGNTAAAQTHLEGAIEAFERLAELSPADLENRRKLAISHRMLADALATSGDGEAAIESYERARTALGELAAGNPDVPEYAADLAGVRMNLAQQLDVDGDAAGALAEMLAAVELLRKAAGKPTAPPRRRCDLGVALRAAGQLLARQSQRDEARRHLVQSKEVLERLVREHPGETLYAGELQLTADALGELEGI